MMGGVSKLMHPLLLAPGILLDIKSVIFGVEKEVKVKKIFSKS